jgi:thiol:disulfide interchange protein DsbD
MYSFFSVKDDSLQPNGTKSVLAFSIIILFLFVQFQLSKSSSPDIIPNNLEKISISGVDWRRDLEGSLLEAKNHDKKVFIDFSADWCTNCKVFESNLSKDTELQNAINEFSIPVRIEDTDPIFEKLQIDRRFEELKIGLPLYAVLASDGALIWKTNQFKDREGMIQALREVK